MAKGDVEAALSSISDDAALTIRPASGEEWCIKNIMCPYGGAGDGYDLYFCDGTNEIKIDTANAGWAGQSFDLTYSYFLKVYNRTGGSAYIGYTGIETKAAA